MARRQQTGSEGGVNLDSLMDALTNVVAVLILVLILVQADVTQKVGKLFDDLVPASPNDITLAEDRLATLEKRHEQLDARLKADAPTPKQIEEERRQLALLEKSVDENTDFLADLEKLRALESQLRPERETENTETVRLQTEIAKLEAHLDETPAVAPPKPAVVSIPNSRPIPPKARLYYAIVMRERVHFIDPFTPMEVFEDEFKRHKSDWLVERLDRKGADRLIYDGRQIAAHFKTVDFKNSRKQTVEVIANPTGTRLALVITPDPAEGGTPLSELPQKDSLYAKTLGVLGRDARSVLLFRVHPDSFATYLEARTLADAARVPAGWEVHAAPNYWMPIEDIEIKRLEEPPPPPVNPPPAPPQPPKLDPKLD